MMGGLCVGLILVGFDSIALVGISGGVCLHSASCLGSL